MYSSSGSSAGSGDTLHIHLGLFGKFRAAARPAAEPRGAVRVRLESATHVVDCNGPTACEVLRAGVLQSTAQAATRSQKSWHGKIVS